MLKGATLVGELSAPVGQLLQADHLRLIGIEQTLIGPDQPGKTGRYALPRSLFLNRAPIGSAGELLELGDQLVGVAQEIADVLPYGPLQRFAVDAGARTGLRAGGFHAVLAGAAVGVALGMAGRRPGDAVHGETTGAARQQAAQQVIVLLVVAERQDGVTGELCLSAVPSLLIDDGRYRDRDPLLLGPQPAAACARIVRLARARLLRRHVLVTV